MVSQKKVCHGRSPNTGGGGLPNPTESTTWGHAAWGEELVISPRTHDGFRLARSERSFRLGAYRRGHNWGVTAFTLVSWVSLGASPPPAWGRHCLSGDTFFVFGYWEMDEGIEGRSGVTLAGSNSVS